MTVMMMPGARYSIRVAHCLLIHEIDFPIRCAAMSSCHVSPMMMKMIFMILIRTSICAAQHLI